MWISCCCWFVIFVYLLWREHNKRVHIQRYLKKVKIKRKWLYKKAYLYLIMLSYACSWLISFFMDFLREKTPIMPVYLPVNHISWYCALHHHNFSLMFLMIMFVIYKLNAFSNVGSHGSVHCPDWLANWVWPVLIICTALSSIHRYVLLMLRCVCWHSH